MIEINDKTATTKLSSFGKKLMFNFTLNLSVTKKYGDVTALLIDEITGSTC